MVERKLGTPLGSEARLPGAPYGGFGERGSRKKAFSAKIDYSTMISFVKPNS